MSTQRTEELSMDGGTQGREWLGPLGAGIVAVIITALSMPWPL